MLDACTEAAERIRYRIGEARLTRRTTGEEITSVTVSIGVAQFRMAESAEGLIERCDRAMLPYCAWSLLAELDTTDAAQSRLGEIDILQPALFAIQVALAALWQAWGVEPDARCGQPPRWEAGRGRRWIPRWRGRRLPEFLRRSR